MSKTREYASILSAVLVTLLVFFRVQLESRFSLQFGDQYDGMIEVNLLQHWSNVVHGIARWNVVNYLYPYRDTLGYNDGYLYYGLLFVPFHALGADALLAAELVNIVIRAVGVVGMYALLRGPLKCRLGWSLLGAMTFSLANNSTVQAGHVQLLMVSLVPVASIFVWRFLEALFAEQNRKIILWGSATALLFSGWMLSGYYTAWFSIYFLEIFALVALTLAGKAGRALLLQRVRSAWKPLGRVLVLQVGSLIPFLSVYLPKLKETGGHGWHTPRFYSPNLIDVVNVGQTTFCGVVLIPGCATS